MSTSAKPHTIIEHDRFFMQSGGDNPFEGDRRYRPLPQGTFTALKEFILANKTADKKFILANKTGEETEPIELLSISARRGIGEIITARNYVGLITMKDGTAIEILPKICGADSGKIGEEDTRRIFLKMLRALKNAPFKEFKASNLKTGRLNIFEIFISMFVTEVTALVKQGLMSSYIPVEANERFFKGKLNVAQNIRYNYVNRERFFVGYDEWGVNRPENRLLKETLRFLQKQTNDARNRLNILGLLSYFDGVEASADYEADFSKCVADRAMSHYGKALAWCGVFLRRNSFTAFAGSESAIALLFPMEKVFECYVAAVLRRLIKPADVELLVQDTQHWLFDEPKRFNLRPDIVLKVGGKTVVMDTKWKLLSKDAVNYGISQADMYQMYAYGKKYDAEKVVLLYPLPDENLRVENIKYGSADDVKVEVSFIDLSTLSKPDGAIETEFCEIIKKFAQVAR